MNTTMNATTNDTAHASVADILTTAKKFDTDRRIRAVNEFPSYRLMPNGDLINMKTGEIYTADRFNSSKGWVGCSCPDSRTRVAKMRDALTAAGLTAHCSCKHRAIRQLLNGESVRIGSSTFTAKKK